MNPDFDSGLPDQWRGPVAMLLLPLRWLAQFSLPFCQWLWNSEMWQAVAFKRIFLFLPGLAVLLGLWCSLLTVYTLVFRGGRNKLAGTLLVLWWDVARTAWLYWAGMFRFLWVCFASIWGLVHLMVRVVLELARETFELPFVLTGTITRNLSQPGVPWFAFLLTLAWSAIEALVFTYVLTPTMSEILSDLTGLDTHRLLPVVLYIMLFFMISGSFACMFVLVDSFAKRDIKQAAQMLVVEFFVMFVEVMFLYRELVDALTPWIAQQTGMQMGAGPVIALASFSWLGIRGMTWFLFARYGTPTMLALISRQRLPEEAAAAATHHASAAEERWDHALAKIKKEQTWFQERAQLLLEAAILPSFQVVAAGINFGMVFISSRPIFSLPFKNLGEVGETKALLAAISKSEDRP